MLPEYYKGIRTHKKMYEIRKDEGDIKPGDILVLREWDGEKYTGGKTRREVTSVLRHAPQYGLEEGYCLLSLQVPGWDYLRPQATLDEAQSQAVDWDAMIETIKLEGEESKNFIPKDYALWIELDDVIEIINKYRNGGQDG